MMMMMIIITMMMIMIMIIIIIKYNKNDGIQSSSTHQSDKLDVI